MEELVFAIPTNKLWKLIPYKEKGLITGTGDILNRIVQDGLFRKRGELEEDPSYKQVIPYAFISNEGSFYVFRRISGQSEKRLHNKLHMGVGGHMNPGASDVLGEQYLTGELKREFFEEVRLLNDCKIEDIEFIGFINDDSIPVGRVHIGLLYIIRVSSKDIVINETGKMSAEWIDKNHLPEYFEEMESWTRIAIDHCIK